MKKIYLTVMLLLMFCGVCFASVSPDRRISGYDSINAGGKTVTTAGTAVQLSSTSVPALRVTVCASSDNSGIVAVGGSSVVASALSGRTGLPIAPEAITSCDTACVVLYQDDLNNVWIDAEVSGDSVNYIYEK